MMRSPASRRTLVACLCSSNRTGFEGSHSLAQVREQRTALGNLHRKTIDFAAVRREGAESYLEHVFALGEARSVHLRSKPKVFAKE